MSRSPREDPTQGAVSGQIEFEGGVPSLEGAAVHIFLEDTTYADASAVLVLHEVVAAVPRPDGTIPFELRNTVVDEQATYSIRVLVDRDADGRISSGDYINMASYPVLTRGHPSEVRVRAKRVS